MLKKGNWRASIVRVKKSMIIIVSFFWIMLLINSISVHAYDYSETTFVTITGSEQVVDSITVNGKTVNAVFRTYDGTNGTDSYYSCAAFVKRFYSEVYGINVYNLVSTKAVPKDLNETGSFIEVSTPQVGDIVRDNNSVHWAIVKEVRLNEDVVIIQQNAWGKDRTAALVGVVIRDGDPSVTYFRHTSVDKESEYDGLPIIDTSFFYDSGTESITTTGARIDATFATTQSNATSMGFYLGTDVNNMQKYSETNSSQTKMIYYYLGTGKWTQPLSPNTTYYYKLWAVVNGKTYETPVSSFTTKAESGATVDSSFFYDSGVEAITDTGARIDATFATTQSNATSMGFYLGTDANNMQKYSEDNSSKTKMIFYYLGTGKWTDALTPGTTYYYKLWSKVNGVLYETPISSFTTTGINPNEDTTPPVISDVQVVKDCMGYTISCVVTDNKNVSVVQVPTWTPYNGQDDLKIPWEEATYSYGVYSFRVNYSEHNSEDGEYVTHIYAYDTNGNCTQIAADAVYVNKAELHIYNDWNINTSATCTTTGSCSRSCSICGHTETQTIEAIGHTIGSNGVCTNCDYISSVTFGWATSGSKHYWYENGIKQGTYSDPKGVMGDGTVRGREIYDSSSDGWYWLDAVYDGAKACSKEVWMPYIYQNEAGWEYDEIAMNAANSGDMANQVIAAIQNKSGKWVRYDANGKMIKGWYTVSGDETKLYPDQAGNTYYYDPKTGLMAKGYVTIGGTTYHFDEITGALQ